jgi:hypothetical protein
MVNICAALPKPAAGISLLNYPEKIIHAGLPGRKSLFTDSGAALNTDKLSLNGKDFSVVGLSRRTRTRTWLQTRQVCAGACPCRT